MFSAHNFFVDPSSMAYGRPKYDKYLVWPFFLELFAKHEKNGKNCLFFNDFSSSKIVNILGLVIDRGNPRAPLERFIQAPWFEPKFSCVSGPSRHNSPKSENHVMPSTELGYSPYFFLVKNTKGILCRPKAPIDPQIGMA